MARSAGRKSFPHAERKVSLSVSTSTSEAVMKLGNVSGSPKAFK